jgi:hypothetical protein
MLVLLLTSISFLDVDWGGVVTAGIFWLKNRDPENWRDVHNVDHVLGKYIIADRSTNPQVSYGS